MANAWSIGRGVFLAMLVAACGAAPDPGKQDGSGGLTSSGGTSFGEVLAFKNPDGSIVAVIYNSGSAARTTTLGVGGKVLQFSIPARGWATVNWQ